jgi:hypothetical protein
MLIKKSKTKTTDFGKMGLISHNPVINDLKRIRYMVGLRETSIGRSTTNSSKAPEAEDTPSLKDLRDSVYTVMRDVNKVHKRVPTYSK